jgi:hypothetical protein
MKIIGLNSLYSLIYPNQTGFYLTPFIIYLIPNTISHHMARKTFASTVILYNDVPMDIVSELL